MPIQLRVKRDIDVVAADEDTSLGFTTDMMAMRGQVFIFDVLPPKIAKFIGELCTEYPVDEGDQVILCSNTKQNPFLWRADWLEHVS